MLLADEKRKLFELVINHRIKKHEFVSFAQEQGIAAPADMLRRWRDRFYETDTIFVYSQEPRLVNHFCIGADPEFAFGARTPNPELRYKHASAYGLSTVEAFGCDMTGRQAELRAYPSRSVLDVVASILDTFRHMTVACPKTLYADWLSPAIISNDGIGGHVHVGRKRPDMKQVLASLDKLTDLLIRANVVDKEGSTVRKSTTKYGKPSDFRVQPHGFEYRTMPTWLNSPWSAFLTLTLSKLCIFHRLNETMSPDIHTQTASRQTIENLLRAYSNVDDDARIALIGLANAGLPTYGNGDFKSFWGITTAKPVIEKVYNIEERGQFYYPPVIAPSEETKREVFNYLVHAKPIPNRVPTPNWAPYKLAASVHKINFEAHRPGLPEICMGLLSRGLKVHIQGAAPGVRNLQIVHPELLHIDVSALREWCQKMDLGMPKLISDPSSNHMTFYIPQNIAQDYVVDKDMVTSYRNLIYKSGLFPISKAEDVGLIDLRKFIGIKKKPQPLIGSVIRDMEGEGDKDPLKKVGKKTPSFLDYMEAHPNQLWADPQPFNVQTPPPVNLQPGGVYHFQNGNMIQGPAPQPAPVNPLAAPNWDDEEFLLNELD